MKQGAGGGPVSGRARRYQACGRGSRTAGAPMAFHGRKRVGAGGHCRQAPEQRGPGLCIKVETSMWSVACQPLPRACRERSLPRSFAIVTRAERVRDGWGSPSLGLHSGQGLSGKTMREALASLASWRVAGEPDRRRPGGAGLICPAGISADRGSRSAAPDPWWGLRGPPPPLPASS